MTTAVLSVLIFAGLMNRDMLRTSGSELRQLSVGAISLLVFTVVLHRLTQSAMVAVLTGRLQFRRAITASEAHSGCSLAIFGGGAIGTSIKVSMLSGWGVDGSQIASSIAATSIIPLITQWAMTAAAATFFMLRGDTSFANQAALVAGVGLSIGPMVFWATLLTKPKAVAWIARRLQPTANALSRFPLLPLSWRTKLATLDLVDRAESMRQAALPLLGRRGVAAFALAALSNVCVGLILVVTLHGLDITADYSLYPIEAMAALAFARTLGSFAPLPGGMGFLDAGLLSALAGQGVKESSAVAAVALYRASTFIVPIVTGFASILWWRKTTAEAAELTEHQLQLQLLPVS
jgi:uncharacterized membrane protein YbhN (UPF0104 family)